MHRGIYLGQVQWGDGEEPRSQYNTQASICLKEFHPKAIRLSLSHSSWQYLLYFPVVHAKEWTQWCRRPATPSSYTWLSLLCIFYINVFTVHMQVQMWATEPMSEDILDNSVIFYHVATGDFTQVIRFDSKGLYPMHHLGGHAFLNFPSALTATFCTLPSSLIYKIFFLDCSDQVLVLQDLPLWLLLSSCHAACVREEVAFQCSWRHGVLLRLHFVVFGPRIQTEEA